jgi:hypothetical protein
LAPTAYHEAGHAVICCALGFDVEKVTIVPGDEGSRGHNLPRRLPQFRRFEWGFLTGARLGRYHDYTVTLLAGTEAQRHYNPRSVRSYHHSSDYRRVEEILIRLHGEDKPERFAAFRYLKIRARNLVSRETNWVRIEGLAKALLERRTLSGDEVKEVFAATLDAHFGLPPLTLRPFS